MDMKTTTHRDTRHPWNYFKAMEMKFKKILTSKSNENLDALLVIISEDIDIPRPKKIEVLMEAWAETYKEKFERMHHYPLEDTLDEKKFKKHFRKFRRTTKWLLFTNKVRLFFNKINPFKKNKKPQPELRILK